MSLINILNKFLYRRSNIVSASLKLAVRQKKKYFLTKQSLAEMFILTIELEHFQKKLIFSVCLSAPLSLFLTRKATKNAREMTSQNFNELLFRMHIYNGGLPNSYFFTRVRAKSASDMLVTPRKFQII